MFAALVILSTVISAASATKSLSVSTTVPSSLADVDSLQVVTTIANTGDEALRLLNDPDSPLSTWATRSFDVKNADGKDAEFNGVIVRYAPEVAAKSEDASEWTILAPGESVDVTHDVGLYYDFTKTGAGAFPPRTGPEVTTRSGKSVPADLVLITTGPRPASSKSILLSRWPPTPTSSPSGTSSNGTSRSRC